MAKSKLGWRAKISRPKPYADGDYTVGWRDAPCPGCRHQYAYRTVSVGKTAQCSLCETIWTLPEGVQLDRAIHAIGPLLLFPGPGAWRKPERRAGPFGDE